MATQRLNSLNVGFNKQVIMAAGFVASALTFPVCSFAAPTEIPIICDGIDVGTVSVDTVPAAGMPSGIMATFTSSFDSPAVSAALCGDDHFNWYQVVTADNMPPKDKGGNTLTPPYVDPPPGGYQYQQPAGDDYLPWYWSETPLGGAATSEIEQNTSEANGTVTFSDAPGGAAGTNLSFSTWLASVNKDGSFHEFEEGFSWDWSNAGGQNGTNNIQPLSADPTTAQYEDIIGGFDTSNPENFWTGIQGLDWFTPGNWQLGVPAAQSYACLTVANGTAIYDPTVSVPLSQVIVDATGTSGFNLLLQGSFQLTAEVEKFGYHNRGTMTQSAGTNSAIDFYLGYYAGSTGQYVLNNGTLQVSDAEVIGVLGNGSFQQNGGNNYINGALVIAPGGEGTGSYNLQNGQLYAGSARNDGQIFQTGGFAQLGPLTGTGNTTVGNSSGALAMLTISGLQQSSLAINSTGTVRLTGGTNNWVNSLPVFGSGHLDMTSSQLLINYTATDPASIIRNYVISGYNGGAWNGPGISSSFAAANPGYALGYADGASGVVAGLPSGQIEIKCTLYGDANLDGVVNGTDFALLAANFGTSANEWAQGDFDYDGIVNGSDFGDLAANFGKSAFGAQVVLPASQWAALDAFAAAHGLLADVPEPTTFAAAPFAALGLLAKRRRRN
jgi:hypothetical protein